MNRVQEGRAVIQGLLTRLNSGKIVEERKRGVEAADYAACAVGRSTAASSSRHEFAPSAGRPVAGNFGKDFGDISLGVDAVSLVGLDDGVDGSGTFAARARAGEEPVAASDGNTA